MFTRNSFAKVELNIPKMSKNSLDFAQSSMLFSSHFLHFKSVVCPSHLCRVRVTALLVRVESVTVKKFLSRVMTWSSRVRDESQELANHCESLICKLESMSSPMKFHILPMSFFAMKWHPTCYKMTPDNSDSVTRFIDSTRLESRFLVTRTRLESR